MLAQAKTGAITPKGINTAPNHLGHSKAPSGHQPHEAEGYEALEEDLAHNQEGCSACSVEKIRGHITRICQVIIQKQKEIAEGEAWWNQPKQVLHTALCYSPYNPEYVGQ
jgi:hypothetical protein